MIAFEGPVLRLASFQGFEVKGTIDVQLSTIKAGR